MVINTDKLATAIATITAPITHIDKTKPISVGCWNNVLRNAVPLHRSITSVSSSPQTCPSYVPAKYLNKCHQLHESVRIYTRPKNSYRRTRLYFLNAVTYPVSFTALRWCLYCAMWKGCHSRVGVWRMWKLLCLNREIDREANTRASSISKHTLQNVWCHLLCNMTLPLSHSHAGYDRSQGQSDINENQFEFMVLSQAYF